MYLNSYIIDIEEGGIIKLPDLFDVKGRKIYFFLKEEGSLSLFFADRSSILPDEYMIAGHAIPVQCDDNRRMKLPNELVQLTGATKVFVHGKVFGFELEFEINNSVNDELIDGVHRKLKLK